MAVGYRALRERYTSRVTLDPAARTIDVVAIDGPFHKLENQIQGEQNRAQRKAQVKEDIRPGVTEADGEFNERQAQKGIFPFQHKKKAGRAQDAPWSQLFNPVNSGR